jgi:hypothetical protein
MPLRIAVDALLRDRIEAVERRDDGVVPGAHD